MHGGQIWPYCFLKMQIPSDELQEEAVALLFQLYSNLAVHQKQMRIPKKTAQLQLKETLKMKEDQKVDRAGENLSQQMERDHCDAPVRCSQQSEEVEDQTVSSP